MKEVLEKEEVAGGHLLLFKDSPFSFKERRKPAERQIRRRRRPGKRVKMKMSASTTQKESLAVVKYGSSALCPKWAHELRSSGAGSDRLTCDLCRA